MASPTVKTERFINPEDIEYPMEDKDDSGACVSEEYWKAVEAAFDRFLVRFAPNGKIEKFGQTDKCLKFEEFDDYADGRVSKKRREQYEAHVQTCSDCKYVFQELQDYLAQQRSQNRVAILARAAVALPYRIKDYLSERRAEVG
jgi:hypothetical protein